jgi:hypothetical protein
MIKTGRSPTPTTAASRRVRICRKCRLCAHVYGNGPSCSLSLFHRLSACARGSDSCDTKTKATSVAKVRVADIDDPGDSVLEADRDRGKYRRDQGRPTDLPIYRIEERLKGVMRACGDLPASSFSGDTLTDATRTFTFWPGVAEIGKLVRAATADLRRTRSGLRLIACQVPSAPSAPSDEATGRSLTDEARPDRRRLPPALRPRPGARPQSVRTDQRRHPAEGRALLRRPSRRRSARSGHSAFPEALSEHRRRRVKPSHARRNPDRRLVNVFLVTICCHHIDPHIA